MSTALVHRPTEYSALSSQRAIQTPPAEWIADRLLEARATRDRYGARVLDCLLDRALGLTEGDAP
ncbi:hypothetical protein A6E92_22340 [Streptomyces sp. S8]|nr:hypothetical protein A6E92_22340 [Streptomyces sp. S8]